MFPGWMQIGLVVLLIILLFGRGKISDLMGDVAKGITSFRKGLKEGSDAPQDPQKDVAPKSVTDERTIEGETVKTQDTEKTDA